jgi:hypothetical protein
LKPLLAAGCFLSLILAEAFLQPSPVATFYFLPTRAWELLIGALLALGIVPLLSGRLLRELLSFAGLLLIFAPAILYSEETTFPGLTALPPCLGAFLLIHCGRDGGSRVTSFLSARPAAAIGLISYSLYLWHWPVLVVSRQWLVTKELGPGATILALLFSFILAWLSWRFVELPLRDRRRLSRRTVFAGGLGASLLLIAVGFGLTSGLPGRFSGPELSFASGEADYSPFKPCVREVKICALGAGEPSFLLWGDSHAAAIGEAISDAATLRGRSGLLRARGACAAGTDDPGPPVPWEARMLCRQFSAEVERWLLDDKRLRTIVLVSHWRRALERRPVSLPRALDRLIRRLKAAGKEVVLIADLPLPGMEVPWALGMSSYLGRPLPQGSGKPSLDPRLEALARRHGIRLIRLSPAFCATGKCLIEKEGRPLFVDDNHVTSFANRAVIAPYLKEVGLFR